mmetsp:Transcript_60380/g.88437  ORF Transcript_60380/g.88437 Transcript_60380/m.88437 type:complete len:215 (-) Transcript_60380:457-1101(-)
MKSSACSSRWTPRRWARTVSTARRKRRTTSAASFMTSFPAISPKSSWRASRWSQIRRSVSLSFSVTLWALPTFLQHCRLKRYRRCWIASTPPLMPYPQSTTFSKSRPSAMPIWLSRTWWKIKIVTTRCELPTLRSMRSRRRLAHPSTRTIPPWVPFRSGWGSTRALWWPTLWGRATHATACLAILSIQPAAWRATARSGASSAPNVRRSFSNTR